MTQTTDNMANSSDLFPLEFAIAISELYDTAQLDEDVEDVKE